MCISFQSILLTINMIFIKESQFDISFDDIIDGITAYCKYCCDVNVTAVNRLHSGKRKPII